MKRRSFVALFLALIGVRPKPKPELFVMKRRTVGPSCAPLEVYAMVDGEMRRITFDPRSLGTTCKFRQTS